MKNLILLGVVTCLSATGCARIHGDALPPRPLVVADRLYWAGPKGEGNEAYNITAAFNSKSELATILRLDAPLGEFADRSWVLADVLVSVDLNGNGDAADWVVSGPTPLISEYVAKLRKAYEEKKAMCDFCAQKIVAKPTAFFEKDGE